MYHTAQPNLLVRMNQRREFAADESKEYEMFDIIEKMYNIESQNAETSGLEQEMHLNETGSEITVGGIDWEDLEIREHFMTAISAFKKLRRDLIRVVRATKRAGSCLV